MDIFEKAKELGKMIAQSEQMSNYKKSEAAIEADDKSKTLMNEYKMLQIEMVRATKENKPKETIDDVKERLLSKQDEINNYEVTRFYLESKTAFDRFMKQINDVMIFAITGEEPCSPNKCGSCGGGCGQ
ncbi:MAG: YlbF family regulator [Clostridia bacterium]|nr:YlbF family regulator [Clostridia bacterium]